MSEVPDDTVPRPPLRHRPTADLIVMFLAGVIAFTVVATVVGAIVWKINDSTADISKITDWTAQIVNTMVGAVVGYLAGRGATSSNGEVPHD